MKRWMSLLCGLLCVAPALQASESVLYWVTDQSIVYPVTNRLVKASTTEGKTDIFAIDPETGKKRLVFSDANAEFMLLPGGRFPRGIVAAGGRIFSVAIDRRAWANNVGGQQAVYELSTDESGKARKVFDIGNFSNLFVSPSGSEIGYFIDATAEAYLIRETATGKLLRKVDIQSRTLYGEVSQADWMPDGQQIFFSLGVSGDGDDAFWNTPGSPIGTYVVKDNGAVPTRLAPEPELHFKALGKEADIDVGATLIAVLPDGRYLFGDSTAPLYTLDLAKKIQKIIPTDEIVGSISGLGSSLQLSPSGRQLALTATQREYAKQAKFTATSIVGVWVLDLASGKQSKLLSFTTHDGDGAWINLIGWLEEQ